MEFTAVPIEDRDDVEFMYFGCRIYELIADLITDPDARRKFDLLFNILNPIIPPTLTSEERLSVDTMLEAVLVQPDALLEAMPDHIRTMFDILGYDPETVLQHMATALQKVKSEDIPAPDSDTPVC